MTAEYINSELEKLRSMRKLCHRPLALLFVLASLSAFTPAVLKPLASFIGTVCVLVFFATFIYSFKINRFPCPRCGKRFHIKNTKSGFFIYNLFTRKCLNCGLLLNGANSNAQL